MRLSKLIFEERISGNQRRRELLDLPWLAFDADSYELGQAVSEAEERTGKDVKVGMWKNRRVPDNVVIIGKYTGELDEPELPLYVAAGPSARVPGRGDPAASPSAPPPSSKPRQGGRISKTERMLIRVAGRVYGLERQVVLLRWLLLLSILISTSAVGAAAVLLWGTIWKIN